MANLNLNTIVLKIARTLVVFLDAYFNDLDSGLSKPESSSQPEVEQKSDLIFKFLTVLLICMENTFWDTGRDGNFAESFKKSFKFYVESGMMKKMEADFDILRNEQGRHLGTSLSTDFKTNFLMFITEHYLPHDLAFDSELKQEKPLASAHGQELEQEKRSQKPEEKKFTWLQRLTRKIRRGQRL